MASQVIVVGGGLAGLCAAHTVIERGGRVLVLDKNSFMGGNSTKATSGINGALTRTQIELGIKDSAQQFLEDTALSAAKGDKSVPPSPLYRVLAFGSASAVEWLQDKFALDLSLVSRLGGHTFPRTHRGKERFPGMTITYALMEKLEEIAANSDAARIITKARVTSLLNENGAITGVVYEKDGRSFQEYGPVIVATGGFGADFSDDSILKQVRPELINLPTTNGDHCTGDGIKMAVAIGANTKDIEQVQVHPTGLVHPDEPDAKVKFLAAEALRGVGGIMLDRHGKRFCNELGRRDYVTGEMWTHDGPFRLVLNGASSREIEWHCKHYVGRRLMKRFENAAELAADMGVSADVIRDTFAKYNSDASKATDEFGKKYYQNVPYEMNDYFYVAVITPVIHYCMGGLEISPDAEVVGKNGPIPGLYATGEVCGGVHGKNRLGGSSLLDCVVFGRVAGDNITRYLLGKAMRGEGGSSSGAPSRRVSSILRQLNPDLAAGSVVGASIEHGGVHTVVEVAPSGKQLIIQTSWEDAQNPPIVRALPGSAGPSNSTPAAPAAPPAAPAAASKKEYTLDDVAKHNTEQDCWVVVNGEVLDVTKFLPEHPGGKRAILLFAGKDASEEFNMLHKPDVVAKYAPDSIIGTLKK